jgi:uncharacterized protein YndB with AHSA1/START domain
VGDAPGPVLERSIWIDAERTLVFDYFVDAKKLISWMGASARLDAVPGGEYRVDFKAGWTSTGRFVEVQRPSRLVYTVGWEGNEQYPPGSTRVEITLENERGGTRVLLKHYGPPATGVESDGWALYLKRLIAAVEQRSMPEDPFDELARNPAESE